jgi:hypothetical protein
VTRRARRKRGQQGMRGRDGGLRAARSPAYSAPPCVARFSSESTDRRASTTGFYGDDTAAPSTRAAAIMTFRDEDAF